MYCVYSQLNFNFNFIKYTLNYRYVYIAVSLSILMPLEKDTTKIFEGVDEGLKKILESLLKNPYNSLDSQKIIDLTHKGTDEEDHQVATLYLKDKYVEFYDEFDQTAYVIPELRSLVDYLVDNGWDVNLS